MKYEVLTYGRSELRRKAKPVVSIDDGIRRLARDMIETMFLSSGVGLAAEQVGRTEAVCVVDVRPAFKSGMMPAAYAAVPMPIVMVNPRIVEMLGEDSAQEGCLSFPEVFVTIKRAQDVSVDFLSLDGCVRQLSASGFLARAIQHEVDHLEGRLLVDRMSAIQKLAVAAKLRHIRQDAARARREAAASADVESGNR